MKDYSIKISVERITGTTSEGRKYDFLVAKGVDKKGIKSDFKFTRACVGTPQKAGVYLMTVDSKYIKKDKRSIYSIYWISNIKSLIPYDEVQQEEEEDDEELPF